MGGKTDPEQVTFIESNKPYPVQTLQPMPQSSLPPYPGPPNPVNHQHGQESMYQKYPTCNSDQRAPFMMAQPGQSGMEYANPVTNESTYLGLSVFVIICCCWPVGIAALRKSIEARRYYDDGNIENGRKSAKKALSYGIIGIVIGLLILPVLGYYIYYRYSQIRKHT